MDVDVNRHVDLTEAVRERVRDSVDVSEFDVPWQPVPVREAASASAPVKPDRGRGLIYGTEGAHGVRTLLSGEPGVGKSIVLATIAADEAHAGRVVLYLDFERTADVLLERLQAMGLTDEEIDRVRYLHPNEQATSAQIGTMIDVLEPSLVVIDSYDAAIAFFGLDAAKNEDVRAFDRNAIEPLRSRGAPVVIADHVPKDRERRGRSSIGGQAKLALAEAHLSLSVIASLRRGAEGKLKVSVLKDNYGWLPPAAVFTLRSHEISGAISWDVTVREEADEEGSFRPTGLMQSVSRTLEIREEAVSRTELRESVKGKTVYVLKAIDALVREGYAEETTGPRGARLVRLVRPFREDDE